MSLSPDAENEEKKFTFRNKTRFIILIIGLLCIAAVNGNYNIISFTVICMSDVVEEQKITNSTHWLENSADTSFIFSAGAFGAIVGLIPSVPLTARFGVRKVLSFYAFLSGLSTFLMPLAVSIGYVPVVFMRALQGFATSILFSAIGSISEGWSPIAEISTYVAYLSSGFQVSNIVMMPVSGLMCDSNLGWRSIYYLFGGATIIISIVFFVFYQNDPAMHKNVSHKELQKISAGRLPKATSGRTSVPYLAICQDKCVLAIWASALGGNMSFMSLITYGPTYLNRVLGLDVKETGFSNAIPYILAACAKFVSGPISDRMTFIPEVWRIIFFATLSQGGMAVGYFVMALTTSRIIAQIAYTCSIVLAGINIVGVVKCAQMVARQHVHFVMAVISLSAWILIFILPIIIGYACPDHTHEQWSVFFIGVGIWVCVLNIPFPFVATIEASDYTKAEWEPKKRNKISPEEN